VLIRHPPSPRARQQGIFFLWTCLFWTFPVNGILLYVPFSVNLLFTQHTVLKVHPCHDMYQQVIPLYS
jgi:hypothetical protein